MNRLGATLLACGLLATPALAEQPLAYADTIEAALENCHDGVHALIEPSVEPPTIAFQAGSRDVRIFFGNLSVDYAEQGSAGRHHRPEARLTITCTRSVACVWSGPFDAVMTQARAEHGVVPLSALPQRASSLVLYCPDLRAARELHHALLAFQHAVAP